MNHGKITVSATPIMEKTTSAIVAHPCLRPFVAHPEEIFLQATAVNCPCPLTPTSFTWSPFAIIAGLDDLSSTRSAETLKMEI